MVRTRQEPRESVGEGRTRSEGQSQEHAPQMPSNTRRARDAAGQDDLGIADRRKGEYEREAIDRNQYGALEWDGTLEQRGQAGGQLKRQNGKRRAKAEGDEHGDLFENAGRALA